MNTYTMRIRKNNKWKHPIFMWLPFLWIKILLKKKKAKPENSTSWNPLDPEHTRGGWLCWRSPPLKMGPGYCSGSAGFPATQPPTFCMWTGQRPPGLPHWAVTRMSALEFPPSEFFHHVGCRLLCLSRWTRPSHQLAHRGSSSQLCPLSLKVGVTILPRYKVKKKTMWGTSLVIQWLKLQLPMQGAQVQSLVRELDPTCHN